MEHARQVHREGAVPGIERRVLRPAVLIEQNAGVVEQNVDAAERLLGLAHHGFDRGLLGDVRADGDPHPTRLAHACRGLLGAAEVAIGGGNTRSLARKQ